MDQVEPMGTEPVSDNGSAKSAEARESVPSVALPISSIPYKATVHTAPGASLPPEFASAVIALEQKLNLRVWMLVQSRRRPEESGNQDRFLQLEHDLVEALISDREHLPAAGPVALLIDSPGGQAKCAFEIASYLRKRCGGYKAIVPRWAKSAATLLAIGADELTIGEAGELGPLDVQLWSDEREQWESALNEIQALERLNAFALESLDQAMFLLVRRMKKRTDVLMPKVSEFVAQMVRPLFEKIDVVHYTQTARDLKVGEDYAVRLLTPRFGATKARAIARSLVADYSEHDFLIDRHEALQLGLEPATVDPEMEAILYRLRSTIDNLTAVGHLEEVG